ncbi:MAG: hypothetical protein ACI9JR_002179 [Gammaproteobacteria bacterium]
MGIVERIFRCAKMKLVKAEFPPLPPVAFTGSKNTPLETAETDFATQIWVDWQ